MKKTQKKVVELFFYVALVIIGIIAAIVYKPEKPQVVDIMKHNEINVVEQAKEELEEWKTDDFIPIE